MDASAQDGRSAELATHYEVLGLTPAILASHHNSSSLLKKAYRRALLQHHPDKTAASAQASPNQTTSHSASRSANTAATSPSRGSSSYTIDQITTAFTTLSSPSQRAAYDASLRLLRSVQDDRLLPRFQTGVENVDLDDLDFDEGRECWFRSCRCGNDRGYVFDEKDLEEVGDEGELMVGCLDCSLWLRVHFAVLEE